MRPYEVVIILDSGADEVAVESVLGRVRDGITSRGGKVGEVQKWGRRRFAYELKHRWEGNYSLVEFTAEPTAIADLDRILTLSDDVLRHKIVRLPEGVAGRVKPNASSEPAIESTTETAGV